VVVFDGFMTGCFEGLKKTQLDVCYKLCKSVIFILVHSLVLLCELTFLFPVCCLAIYTYFIDQIAYSFSLGNSSLGKALSEALLNFVIIETVAIQNHGSAHFTAA
jgi:TRAP-type mannitol/chloroaromatic compound transport system permease small subunit